MVSENRIFVDARRQIGEIDPNIYGFNVEHIHRDATGFSFVYGAIFDEGNPLSDEHGYRKDVIEACRRIKVPIIRWPGGNFVSGYHWENGVGPRDKRPRLYELAWRSEESNRFGTDEFMEWCRLIGAEPWITVNAGSGTAEEAAHWVEYCNGRGNTYYAKMREKNGHPEPYGTKYWSLGNEMWGDFQIGNLPAVEYARKARDMAKLMRRVDPNIHLTAVGHTLGANVDWDLTVLNMLPDLMDCLSTHRYYREYLSGNEDEDYYRVLACPVRTEKWLKVLKGNIDAALLKWETTKPAMPPKPGAPPIREKDIGISFDEWNISGCHTLRDALGMARLLTIFQRLSRFLRMGSFFPLMHFHCTKKERVGGAPITAYKDRIVLEAGYAAYDLYVNYTGEVAVDSYAESETYDLGYKMRDGRDASLKGVSYLDSSATVSKDGKMLYIAAVNAHLDRDLECLIELRRCSPQRTGRVFELNAQGAKSFNDMDNRENVKVRENPEIQIGQTFAYTFPAHSATVIQIPTT